VTIPEPKSLGVKKTPPTSQPQTWKTPPPSLSTALLLLLQKAPFDTLWPLLIGFLSVLSIMALSI
jgi:hypothetical protein